MRYSVQMFQQNSYRVERYNRWLKQSGEWRMHPNMVAVLSAILFKVALHWGTLAVFGVWMLIIAISEFMSHYPNSEQLHLFSEMTKELTWRMHEKEFVNAYTYFKIERYNSAIVAFRNALKKYPDSHRREDLMYHIVMSSFLLAENSIETKQLDRYLSTLDSYMTFIMEFPESKYKNELERVAETTRRFIDKNQKEE